MKLRKKHRPFISLSKKKRSNMVMSLKNKIYRDEDIYGGKFTSHLVLTESGRPDLYNQQFDFYFLGKDRFTMWNAYIYTVQQAFWNTVDELASKKAFSMLTPEEIKIEFDFKFEPNKDPKTGKILSYALVEKEEIRYEQFNGMTYSEYCKSLQSEIIKNTPPNIYECFKIDNKYAYGIGLNIIIDASSITKNVIEQAIDRFYSIGEKNWASDAPISLEKMPKETFEESLSKVDYPSVLLGMRVRDRF